MGTKADNYLKQEIQEIILNGYKDENPRPHYADGEPAYTYSVNQKIRVYDLSKGEFPITTLRPIAWKTGIREIFTIYQKPTNVLKEMHELGIKYWDDWDIGDGTIGFRYGHTVKRYDLINKLLKELKEDPFGRRHIIDLWQVQEFEEETKGLKPCAFLTIWNVRKQDGKYYLDMTLIQRSGDMLTASGAGGINEIQYCALMMMVARHCGYELGSFAHFVQNEQIYDRHMDKAKIMLYRKPIECSPILKLNTDKTNFFDFTIEDFEFEGYPMEAIKKKNPQVKLELGI